MVRIVVSGLRGRIGKRIDELARKDPELEVVAGVEIKAEPAANIVDDLAKVKAHYDCIMEFTAPKATIEHLKVARRLKKAIVVGTTGLSDDEIRSVQEAARDVPIVFAPNMSVGVNVLFSLIKKAAGILGDDYTVTIREAHHVHKKDKPSGTAKLMAAIVKENSRRSEVPVESVREGEIVGDHDIIFESRTDTLKISHHAKTRDIFVLGALRAAKFVVTKKNGLFSMADVLGI